MTSARPFPCKSSKFLGYVEFITAYDIAGTPQWAQMPPSKGIARARIKSILPIEPGTIIFAGEIMGNGAVDLGNDVTVNCIGAYPNLFVAQYRTPSPLSSRK